MEDIQQQISEGEEEMKEEEVGIDANDIMNDGDNMETLMFGCEHCGLGECIWLVNRNELNKSH